MKVRIPLDTVRSLVHILAGSSQKDGVDQRRFLRAFPTDKPTSSIPAEAWPLLQELWLDESAKEIRPIPKLPLLAK
jgi:hypothetical protein